MRGLGIPRTSTTHATLILTLPPVFIATVKFLLFRQWPKRPWWFGSVMALSGIATLILGRNLTGGGNAGARLSARIGLFAATTWSLFIGAAVAVPSLPAFLGALAQVT